MFAFRASRQFAAQFARGAWARHSLDKLKSSRCLCCASVVPRPAWKAYQADSERSVKASALSPNLMGLIELRCFDYSAATFRDLMEGVRIIALRCLLRGSGGPTSYFDNLRLLRRTRVA